MSLESGNYISDLVATNPAGIDPKSEGDDHLRLVKKCVQQTFPNMAGAVTAKHTQLTQDAFTIGASATASQNLVIRSNVNGTFTFERADGTDLLTIAADGKISGAFQVIPAGAVQAFAMNAAPTGWLAADGASVSRTTYAALFTAIGTVYGSVDGNTFNVPDLRGYFVRGSGTNGDGTAAGTFGAKQADELKSHNHSSRNSQFAGTGAGSVVGYASTTNGAASTTNDTGGTETRPKNIPMLYCIKT